MEIRKSSRLILLSVSLWSVSVFCSLVHFGQRINPSLVQTQKASQLTSVAQQIEQTVQAWMPSPTHTPLKPSSTNTLLIPSDTPTVTPVTPSATPFPSSTPVPSLTPIATRTLNLRVCIQVGCKAPDFTLPTVDNQTASLSDYQGQSVLLNFWTTWCEPCRKEIPYLVAVYEKYKSRGFVVLGVSVDGSSTIKKVPSFVRDNGMTFPVLLDNKGAVDNTYNIDTIPRSFFIDTRGAIKEIAYGSLSKSQIEAMVSRLLAAH